MSLSTHLIFFDVFMCCLVGLLVIRFIRRARKIPQGLRLPPGPPGNFISGNAHEIPTQQEWLTYNQWAKQYGSLFRVEVYGKVMIFVNTFDAARDLFEKRSTIYSDLVDFPMMNDLMGWSWNFAFMRYGEWWRRHRRRFHQYFHPEASTAYYPIQTRRTREFLRNLHQTPDDFMKHIRHLAGAVIMEAVYAINVRPKDDPYIKIAETAMGGMGVAGTPGTFLVDMFPILKYVPEWVPGAGFQKKARVWKAATTEMAIGPIAAVKKARSSGTVQPSVMASMLDDLSERSDAPADEEEVIRNVGAVAYAGGADTTVATLSIFMAAMVLHPEAQKKAQAELDSVLGMNRLPEYGDRDDLPYVRALCDEVHRWHPIIPLAVARQATQDDVYGDYFIPKGSVVVGNAWTVLHDENVYGPRPEAFEPERFLQSGINPPTAQFGFGRRICPGRYMADNSIFLAVASILKVFDIAPAVDVNGNNVPVGKFGSGFLSHPEPFPCSITLRSASAEKLLSEPTDDLVI